MGVRGVRPPAAGPSGCRAGGRFRAGPGRPRAHAIVGSSSGGGGARARPGADGGAARGAAARGAHRGPRAHRHAPGRSADLGGARRGASGRRRAGRGADPVPGSRRVPVLPDGSCARREALQPVRDAASHRPHGRRPARGRSSRAILQLRHPGPGAAVSGVRGAHTVGEATLGPSPGLGLHASAVGPALMTRLPCGPGPGKLARPIVERRMTPFSSWFRCAEGCDFRAALTEVVYQCPRCGGLLEVEHDRAALRQRAGRRVEGALRGPLPRRALAVRLGGLGQEGVGLPGAGRRERGLDGRGGEPAPAGGSLRPGARPRRRLGEAVRRHAHRVLQGPGHDRAGLGREGDAGPRLRRPRGGLRLDRRHLGGAGRLLRRRRHPQRGAAPAREDLDRAAGAAHLQRRPGAGARHRLRRLHAGGEGALAGPRTSTSRTR